MDHKPGHHKSGARRPVAHKPVARKAITRKPAARRPDSATSAAPERRRSWLAPLLVVATVILTVFLSSASAQEAMGDGGISSTQIIALVVLLALSGLMSGSETALTAVGRWKIRQLREEGRDPTGAFALLEKDPTRFITTLLIGNNLVNIAATALVTQLSLEIALNVGVSESVAVAYATGIMTVLVLIFGEITPKSFAVHNAVAMARVVIRPVYVLSIVLYPIGLLFTYVTTSILRLAGLEPRTNPLITENELRLMLRSAEESGVIEAQEQEMIKGVIDLEETTVREVMTPRVDIEAVSEEATLHDLLQATLEHGYSRFPVYQDTVDNIRGIIYARDLLRHADDFGSLGERRVADQMTSPQYVPETLSILNLLRDMRLRKNHMAVVVDEFGGTAGIVTLEDIIEEITGEIYDETDIEEEEEIVRLEPSHFRILGSANLEKVADVLKLGLDEEGEYDTLAGFLISRFGYIPEPGESLEEQGYQFTIEEADERRITQVIASPVDGGDSDEKGEASAETSTEDVASSS